MRNTDRACPLCGFSYGRDVLKNQIAAFGAAAFLIWIASTAQAQSPPALSVRAVNNQSVTLAWPKSASTFVLAATEQLGPPSLWQMVPNPPVSGAEEFLVTLEATGATRFFRLQRGGGPEDDDDDDGLLNTNEIARGTNPSLADTDGDGWSDGVEVADGTDPLNPSSTPRTWFVGRPPLDVVLPSLDEIETAGSGLTIGGPPIETIFLSIDEVDGTLGITLGRPALEIIFPALDEIDATSGITIGRPPLEVVFPSLDEIDGVLTGLTLGRPPISVGYVPLTP